jgi:hypothetical protein
MSAGAAPPAQRERLDEGEAAAVFVLVGRLSHLGAGVVGVGDLHAQAPVVRGDAYADLPPHRNPGMPERVGDQFREQQLGGEGYFVVDLPRRELTAQQLAGMPRAAKAVR